MNFHQIPQDKGPVEFDDKLPKAIYTGLKTLKISAQESAYNVSNLSEHEAWARLTVILVGFRPRNLLGQRCHSFGERWLASVLLRRYEGNFRGLSAG